MNIYDLHCHTTFSDGDCKIEYIIEKAKELGYSTGVSDHLFCDGNNTVEDIRRYLDHMTTLGIPVGGEANIGEDLRLSDKDVSRFDYLIASVHAVFPEDGKVALNDWFGVRHGIDESWPGYDTTRAAEFLNLAYLSTVKHFERFRADILGHSSMLAFYEDLPYDSREVLDWEDGIIQACKKYNVAIEISGQWKQPQERMLRKALKAGLKFSFGSDAHLITDVGNLKYCYDMINLLGLTEENLFVVGG